jgi:hypothetical protein
LQVRRRLLLVLQQRLQLRPHFASLQHNSLRKDQPYKTGIKTSLIPTEHQPNRYPWVKHFVYGEEVKQCARRGTQRALNVVVNMSLVVLVVVQTL